jgi:hypothetical protein
LKQLGITRFDELVAHIDGLADAGRKAGVDGQAVEFVHLIRQRLVRIQNYLEGRPPATEPQGEIPAKAVADTDDFMNQFGEIAEAARGAGLSATITHYLHTARLRIRFTLRGSGGRRIVSRDEKSGSAELSHPEGTLQVEVVDSSAYGVGVLAEEGIPTNTVVHLTTFEEERTRRYDCLVVYSEPHRFKYHLGLEIFAIRQ